MKILLMLFLTLLFWHAVADYPLQGFLATAKRRDGGVPGFPWPLALFTHAYIHAFGVLVITGNLWGGAIELVAHYIIDHLKANRNAFGMWADQALHVLTKVVILTVLHTARTV